MLVMYFPLTNNAQIFIEKSLQLFQEHLVHIYSISPSDLYTLKLIGWIEKSEPSFFLKCKEVEL